MSGCKNIAHWAVAKLMMMMPMRRTKLEQRNESSHTPAIVARLRVALHGHATRASHAMRNRSENGRHGQW